ncbi:MAG: SpoIIE family protein phosphatase [Acidobacteriota bacterium]
MTATGIWNELLGLAGRDGGERPYLERLLDAWCARYGVGGAGLYVDTERGAERIAAVGGAPFPALLAEASEHDLIEVRVPGGLVAYRRGGASAGMQTADPLPVLLACALRNHRLRRQIDQQRFQANYRGVELEALYEVGLAIASTLDPQELAEVILSRAVSLLDARRGALYLLEGGRYRLKHTVGGDAPPEFAADHPGIERLRREEDEGLCDLLPGAAHLLCVPISIEDSPRGMLAVGDKERRGGFGPFAANDRRTLGLFANQAAIALENVRLHIEALAKERLEREMQLAGEIQSRILPKGVPATPGFDLMGWNRPAQQVGGDYYDFLPMENGNLGVTVGDVSGKGIPAALLVSTLHSAVRLMLDRVEVGPILLQRLNQHIHASSAPNKFITLLLAQLDLETGDLRYVNAGHNPGLLIRADGSSTTLEPGGLPLGLLAGGAYRCESLHMGPGDLLCLYSDGITEAASPSEEEFGLDRLCALLTQYRGAHLQELVQLIDVEVREFSAGQPQGDDQTLVLLRRAIAGPLRSGD